MPFVKGQSGNPSGRPGIPKHVRDALDKRGPDALEKLFNLMDHAESEKVQLAASSEILDRWLGKAPQSMELTGELKDNRPQILLTVIKPEDASPKN